MSGDERCQVKCCERHLMCFISVCLNCPGTLESLSVRQTQRNETRRLSSADARLSAVTQADTGKRHSELLRPPGDMIAPCCSGNCSCGIISLHVSWREERGHTLELIQTSGFQEHQLFTEAVIWMAPLPRSKAVAFQWWTNGTFADVLVVFISWRWSVRSRLSSVKRRSWSLSACGFPEVLPLPGREPELFLRQDTS